MFSLLIEGGLLLHEHKSKNVHEPIYIEAEGKRIGIFYYEEDASFNQVASLKAECDFVIVLHHGGEAYYRYPTPQLREACHELVDQGADLVVCYGSHCIGAMEEYQDRTIVYGQGDFEAESASGEIEKENFSGETEQTEQVSLIVKVILEKELQVSFLPICKKGDTIRRVKEEEAERILLEFRKRSRMIQVPGEMEALFRQLISGS